jgi:hypothetical protein
MAKLFIYRIIPIQIFNARNNFASTPKNFRNKVVIINNTVVGLFPSNAFKTSNSIPNSPIRKV